VLLTRGMSEDLKQRLKRRSRGGAPKAPRPKVAKVVDVDEKKIEWGGGGCRLTVEVRADGSGGPRSDGLVES
jgi:hypothetical protein